MEICARVDDVVWGASDNVWDDTFMIVSCGTLGSSVLLNEIMRWITTRVTEYEHKYLKVEGIHEKLNDPSEEGVKRLMLHYRDLMLRYRIAYDSCKAVDLVM